MNNMGSTIRIISIISFAILFSGCSENSRTEIIDRWENGSKKRVVNYVGEGENEKITEEKLFTTEGRLFMKIDRQKSDTTFFPNLYDSFSDSTINGMWEIQHHYLDSSGHEINTFTNSTDSLVIKDEVYAHKSIAKNLDKILSLTIQEVGFLKFNESGQIWMLPTKKTISSKFIYENKLFDEKKEVTSLSQGNLILRKLDEGGNIVFKTNTKYDTYQFDEKTELKPIENSFYKTFLRVEKDTLKRIVRRDSVMSEIGIYSRIN